MGNQLNNVKMSSFFKIITTKHTNQIIQIKFSLQFITIVLMIIRLDFGSRKTSKNGQYRFTQTSGKLFPLRYAMVLMFLQTKVTNEL